MYNPYTFIVLGPLGTWVQPSLLDLQCWIKGRCFPSILNDFDGWWIAQMLYKGIITEIYVVKNPTPEDLTMLPLTPVSWNDETVANSRLVSRKICTRRLYLD
jgi:hypothetical protein